MEFSLGIPSVEEEIVHCILRLKISSINSVFQLTPNILKYMYMYGV